MNLANQNFSIMNAQLTPKQQNDLLAMCPCREAGKVEVVTCPDKNNIWLKAFMHWAYLLSQTEDAATLVIMQDKEDEKNALNHLLSTYGLTQIDQHHINHGVYTTIDDIKQVIKDFQAQHQESIYVLMEHYTGTDKTEQAKDLALVQQVAQETHVPITLIQYNNEVF